MSDRKIIISVKNVTKNFGSVVTAVDNVSIDIREGEFFALLGPSGCGKTTLLRMIAGFETPTQGQILIDGVDMVGIDPNRRPVNMVFQSYAVFPHMTVAENVGYGLKVTGVNKVEIKNRTTEALELVKLDGFENRLPAQLSGGQRQRVALARALVKKPRVLLLDEPLSALDAKLREQMQMELANLQAEIGITFIIVTHDQDEALSMADRIAVMEDGQVRQLAGPDELYEYPNCRFVADFIGKTNLFEARITGTGSSGLIVESREIGTIEVPFSGNAEGNVAIAVRPEKVFLSRDKPTGPDIKLKGKVTQVAYYGDESHVLLENATGVIITANVPNTTRGASRKINEGDEMWINWQSADTLILTR